MSGRVVVVSPEELVSLVESAVAKALRALPSSSPATPTETLPLFWSEAEVVDRYRVGRRELRAMILDGRMPSTTRRVKGGNEAYFIRVDDADRVLGNASTAHTR